MVDIPFKATRRWTDFKFIYTNDDGSQIVTSQRISKDSSGNYVLDPTPLLNTRKINDTKTKFWGKPNNLRKLEISYEESKNKTGVATLTRYCPYSPNEELKEYVNEVKEACDKKFSKLKNFYCLDYRGENRFTQQKPESLK